MNPIAVVVRGISVTGFVLERSHSDVEIELVDPFGGMKIRHSSHIMSSAQPYLTFEGEYGNARLRELLRESYEAAFYAFENGPELRVRWRRLSEAVAARCRSRVRSKSELVRLRAASRKLLRTGVITQKEHERRLKLASDEFDDWLFAVEGALDELWRDMPVSLSISLRHQLMRLVDPAFPQESFA